MYSASNLSASSTTRAARMTSFPIPSPGIQAILYMSLPRIDLGVPVFLKPVNLPPDIPRARVGGPALCAQESDCLICRVSVRDENRRRHDHAPVPSLLTMDQDTRA